MPPPPQNSANPQLFIAAPAPTSSAIPFHFATSRVEEKNSGSSSHAPPKPQPEFPLPKLRLEVRDLSHPGARSFLSSVVPTIALEFAVKRVLELLYITPKHPKTTVPDTRSVTLVIRSMPGVAYTIGSELDSDHKEIHFSAEYIDGIDKSRKADEILGVLTHEMVHCYQYNGHGTCPGGLVEGIADWVRLNSGLRPPHWKRDATGKWDAGYDHTGYFLDYLEHQYGFGTVSKMNEKLRVGHYREKYFWKELLGSPIESLWEDYGKTVRLNPEVGSQLDGVDTLTDADEEVVVISKLAKSNLSSQATIESPTPTVPSVQKSSTEAGPANAAGIV